MAKHIHSLNIDNAVKRGEMNIVHEISENHNITNKNFYSFATKYCSWHNPKEYPIFDLYVKKILLAYKKQDKFSEFKATDLKNISQFKNILIDFKKYYKIKTFSLKQIDKFLWITGQKIFKKQI